MTLAAVRPVPNLHGETRVGDTVTPISPDTKRVANFLLLAPARIAKLTLCCDGGGGAAPTLQAKLRGVVYQGGVLLGVGDEVVVTSGDPLRWVDLPLTMLNPGGVLAAIGSVQYGVIVGGDAGVLRVAQIDPLAPGGATNADTYTDGPSNPIGSLTTLTASTSIFATLTIDWSPRELTPAYLVARYGFLDAQKFLAGTLLNTPTFEVTTSWHGTSVDLNRGSFAVVRSGGALDSIVGNVIKVTSKTHPLLSVYAYVWAKVPVLDEDLSLARRAFAAIDLLSLDQLDVHVDVVG